MAGLPQTCPSYLQVNQLRIVTSCLDNDYYQLYVVTGLLSAPCHLYVILRLTDAYSVPVHHLAIGLGLICKGGGCVRKGGHDVSAT